MDPGDYTASMLSGLSASGWQRRLLAAALTALAVVTGLSALTPKPPRTLRVWAAARDLAGGAPLAAADVVVQALPVVDVPAGALRAAAPVIGRLLAAPVRRGEPLTDVRLLGPPLLAALGRPDLVAVPVRVADGSAASALVHAGDLVDVLASPDAAGGGPSTPTTVATALRVLALPGRDPGGGDPAGLVVVAATRAQAAALAAVGAGPRLSLILRHP